LRIIPEWDGAAAAGTARKGSAMSGRSRSLLVTGGSRGIGAAVCRLAGQRGYRVAVNYVENERAALGVVADIEAAGGEAFAVAGDVGREADILGIFEEIDRRFGRLDALVNNAGVVDRAQRVEDMDLARLRRMFDINVLGSILCAREAVKRMSTKHGGAGGAIVNVSSAASRLGAPGQYVDYAASKGAIDSFTLGLAKEVAAEGIRVNAVRPGLIETDIHASGGIPDRVKQLEHQVPMQRGGSAEEVAESIVWLLSPEASYVTMSLLEVSGGR
jgi:NAD(P)-dependent dehydrogenase (short-subunit alcohol dehydrogenase family)